MKVVGVVRVIALDAVELVHLSNGENHGFPELVWLVVLLIFLVGFLSCSGSLSLDRALLVHTMNWSSNCSSCFSCCVLFLWKAWLSPLVGIGFSEFF